MFAGAVASLEASDASSSITPNKQISRKLPVTSAYFQAIIRMSPLLHTFYTLLNHAGAQAASARPSSIVHKNGPRLQSGCLELFDHRKIDKRLSKHYYIKSPGYISIVAMRPSSEYNNQATIHSIHSSNGRCKTLSNGSRIYSASSHGDT